MKDVDDVERSGSYARLLETAWYLGGLGVSFIYSVSSFVSELRVEDCRNQLARLVIIVRHRTISKHAERKCQGISINAAFDSADPLVRNDEPIWSGESCGVLAIGFKLLRC